MGTPSAHQLEWITSPDAREWVNQLEFQQGHDLRKIFKNGKPEAIDLIRMMLEINPNERIRVDEALAHPYFSKLHHPRSEKVINPADSDKITKHNFDSIDSEFNSISKVSESASDKMNSVKKCTW